MKTWGAALMMLLVAIAAVGQDAAQTIKKSSIKTIHLSGTMSDEGRVLLHDSEGKVWTVINPEMLHGVQGEEVVIRGQLVPESQELRVVSVKPAKKEYVANWGDSAFRR